MKDLPYQYHLHIRPAKAATTQEPRTAPEVLGLRRQAPLAVLIPPCFEPLPRMPSLGKKAPRAHIGFGNVQPSGDSRWVLTTPHHEHD
jgi:hypothetical protein